VLIKLHSLIKVENLPYLKMLPPRNLSLSDDECGHVVICLRVGEELGEDGEDTWVQRVTTFLLLFFLSSFLFFIWLFTSILKTSLGSFFRVISWTILSH